MSDEWNDPADIYSPDREPVEKTMHLMNLEWEKAVYMAIPYPDDSWRQGLALVNPQAEPFDRVEALRRLFTVVPRAHFVVEINVPASRSNRPDMMMTPHYEGFRLAYVEMKEAVPNATAFAQQAVTLHGL